MNKKFSWATLAGMLLLSIAPWSINHIGPGMEWADIIQPFPIFGLIAAIGSVVGAYLVNPAVDTTRLTNYFLDKVDK